MNVTELVLFKTREKNSIEQIQQAAAPIGDFLNQQDGFISRRLSYDGDNEQWVCVIDWRDKGAAVAALDAVKNSESCQAFFQLIDESSVDMRLLDNVITQR